MQLGDSVAIEIRIDLQDLHATPKQNHGLG